MRLYHEIIELTAASELAIAVARPAGAPPMPAEHADRLRCAADVAHTRRDEVFVTRINDDVMYFWHLIPSPMRKLERMFH